MARINYFKDYSWKDLTREERFYCFKLYDYAEKDPAEFARWVAKHAEIDIAGETEWDIGVEVCFYRDYLWHKDISARENKYPSKRTFDLCLFGQRTIIIIEAKVFQGFNEKQMSIFDKDKETINRLPGLEKDKVSVKLVALASSHCPVPDGAFDGSISWKAIGEEFYKDGIFLQADNLYKDIAKPLLNDHKKHEGGESVARSC